jgi:hypothetical protein
VPETVGVPEIRPLAVAIVKPAGNPVALNWGEGTPLALTLKRYGAPTLPAGGEPLVMVGAPSAGGLAPRRSAVV